MNKWQLILPSAEPDWTLLTLWAVLVSIGVTMVASASIAFAAAQYGDTFYFVERHLIFLLMGVASSAVVFLIPGSLWKTLSVPLMVLALVLLVMVLIPGVGKKVNGSQRWISFGFFAVQISELAKFAVIVFFASYFAKRHPSTVNSWKEFGVLIALLGMILMLLVMEPDFGSTVVIGATSIAIMFIAGLKLRYFLPMAMGAIGVLAVLAVASPYRLKRLVTFMDPWADQFNSGYQLTQSLIAFGRGEWLGVGLGNSVQKLFYLPEAHTDFVFSIFAEEMGLIGCVVLLALFALLIKRILLVAMRCYGRGLLFYSYACFGVAIIFALQVFINIGVACGLLPTKGLTLPFISYGGSSLIVCCSMLALVMRASMEVRVVPATRTAVTNSSRVRPTTATTGSVA
ncbi:putative lipid II flippase FtsW [Gilvimarinus sp. SDUM040013]|uniref:Probable peptidoglycan glycosyltransferase FtsW n=1 Tax=Gilvimarinus gilvus TaxID=3058038 RepID=A0ABU4RST4_9GAMM|nr:putative lipid II flippase FtsW [Gilvimarinus sp. SDUM040013]MDO3388392.1 putative lipid II flippase FtsW [Gilvimarinus sp. SDUM040013]MDX6847942.1 putative lipid II flippase FtsW [Gilvimarinus sp. SDUM040013]